MTQRICLIYGVTLFVCLFLYKVLSPGFADLINEFILLFMISLFLMLIARFVLLKKYIAFIISFVFVLIGLFIIYSAFNGMHRFSILDYLFVETGTIYISDDNGNIYGYAHPPSYFMLETLMIHCSLSLVGILGGSAIQKYSSSKD